MKPPPFRYVAAENVDEACAALAEHGPDAKVLAGGQSLVPMLNFRLVEPAVLVDINRIAALDRLNAEGDVIKVGALTRHRALEESALVRERLPILAEAIGHVAHFGVRNRGTFGGSLCHADPAAELPMMAALLDARIRAVSGKGTRTLAPDAFFAGPLSTTLEPDEIVTEIELAALPRGTAWSFEEFARRPGDYALTAVAITLTQRDGRCTAARIALAGVGPTPLRAGTAEALLAGHALDAGHIAAAAAAARDATSPDTDLHASADFRRHLVERLTERGIGRAWRRATGGKA